MTPDQYLILVVLVAAMALFVWGRWRYDVVAIAALTAAVLVGVVPGEAAFAGFGHPAVITVAAVLVISRALQNSGVLEAAAKGLAWTGGRPLIRIAAFAAIAAVMSAFMNNVGALALLMPLALQSDENPSRLLMPLSFASILGGLATMIGTPPNIIVATYRAEIAGAPFGLFDFSPVGGSVALVGVLFVAFVGWRLIPKDRRARRAPEDLFEIDAYIAEARVPEKSKAVGATPEELESGTDGAVVVLGLERRGRRRMGTLRHEPIEAGDVLVLKADPAELHKFVESSELELPGDEERRKVALGGSDEIAVVEAVVPPGARSEGRTIDSLRLRRRFGVNLLALARQGRTIRERLRDVRLRAGDVVLLQGAADTLPDAISAMGCLPLAERGLKLGRRREMVLPVAVFAAALAATAVGLVPVQIAFVAAVVALVLLGLVTPREVYESVDWPVIVLLGAMIPLGRALETTGATETLAGGVAALSVWLPPIALIAIVMVVTMTLSDIMNNAATAVVMAPIGAGIAQQLGVSADPFLMAVAIGASCAFLTPIGHQNNILVMGPGGYRFGDYWRMGLPLEVLIVALAVPLIAVVWPL